MSSQLKLLLVGGVAGYFLMAAADFNSQRLDDRVNRLHAECEEQKRVKTDDFAQYLLCDATQLAASQRADSPGIQGELARAERERQRWVSEWEGDLTALGFLTIVISFLPWTWHFVLRRIRELSIAIRGT